MRRVWTASTVGSGVCKCFGIPGKREDLFARSRLCHHFPGQLPHRPKLTKQVLGIWNILSSMKLCLLLGKTYKPSSRVRLCNCGQAPFCLLLSEDCHHHLSHLSQVFARWVFIFLWCLSDIWVSSMITHEFIENPGCCCTTLNQHRPGIIQDIFAFMFNSLISHYVATRNRFSSM